MFRWNFNLMLSALLFVSLTACSTSQTPESSSTPTVAATATASSPTPEAKGNDPQKTLVQMQEILSKTEIAVKANDFKQAKETFKDFDEGYWSKIEDNVKGKDKETYKKVESGIDEVSNNLKAPNPNQAKTLAAIQSFAKILKDYTSTMK